jgi:anti-sigma B factor antagonist
VPGRIPRAVLLDPFDEQGTTVVVDGDLDLETAPQLNRVISDQVARGHRHFVVDLSAATFLDSVAIGTLFRSIEPLREDSDAGVVLAGAKGIVERSLLVSGVGQMFTMFKTREEAIIGVTASPDALRQTWRVVRRRRYSAR